MSSGLNQKLDYLDGMRALMAFNVIICHFVCVYYPTMYFAGYAESSFQGLTIFSTTPLSVLVNGNIAVMYFFALTGFLVGLNVFTKQRSEQYIEKKVIMRYCRLLPVVLVATLFAFVLMVLHLNKHLLITNPEVNRSFLEGYCNFTPTLTSLISNIFYSPFLINSDYIGPFWTIKFEFWGYILTLIAASVLKHSKWRRVWYIALGLLISYHLDGRYAVFIMGLFMADLIFNSNPTILNGLYHRWLDNKYFLMACFAVSVYFSCCPLQPSAFWAKFYFLSQTMMRGFGILCLFL